ncbi:zinc ribbon domain-containing protein [candidate division KSB1 bacterium]|nr:zinc ribbon domain-containing protein [candidate division KSB1 bacterium]
MENLTCPKCKHPVDPETNFCPNCSEPLSRKRKPTGKEWKSERTIFGYPLVHIAYGRDELGRKRVAKGVIAIGQYGLGVITIAQFGVGILFGFGQFMLGLIALGQVAFAPFFAAGQIAIGYAAIGQVVLAEYGICQIGWATHLWSGYIKDPDALSYFQDLWQVIKNFFS